MSNSSDPMQAFMQVMEEWNEEKRKRCEAERRLEQNGTEQRGNCHRWAKEDVKRHQHLAEDHRL